MALNLKSLLAGEMKKKIFFDQPYLKPDHPQCTANEFFKEITYMVNLQDIYKLKKTCYDNNAMQYCPILLEIVPEKIRKGYEDCKYLLQIYQNKEKVYEKALQCPIKNWANCWRYLVYSLEEGSEESQYLHIVDMREKTTVKVKNFGQDPLVQFLSYQHDILYASTKNNIEVMSLDPSQFTEEGAELDANDFAVKNIKPSLNILGLLQEGSSYAADYQAVALETKDNQIDFNRLYISDINEDSFDYRWEQQAEVVPRSNWSENKDPIIKVCFVYAICHEEEEKEEEPAEGMPPPEEEEEEGGEENKPDIEGDTDYGYSLALRESGNVDLYWNNMLMDSTSGRKISDIKMTCHGFYFKGIPLQDNTEATTTTSNGTENKAPVQNLNQEVILGFLHKNQTSVTAFQAKKQASDFAWEDIEMKNIQNLVYLYKSFKIITVQSQDDVDVEDITKLVIAHGRFISIFDMTNWKWQNHLEFENEIAYIFFHKKDGEINNCCLTTNGLIYFDILMEDGDYQDVITKEHADKQRPLVEGSILGFCTDPERNEVTWIVHQKEGNNHLTQLYNGEIMRYDVLLDGNNLINIIPIQMRVKDTYYLVQNDQRLSIYQTTIKDGKLHPKLVKHLPEQNCLKGKVHSATAYEINNSIICFDECNMYVITLNPTTSTTVYENIFCIGIQNFNKSYNYAICQENPNSKAKGLRLFDMERIVQKNDGDMILAKDIDIGTNGIIEFSQDIRRMGFMRSFAQICIIPILHRNSNYFMGMSKPSDYVCYKTVNDDLYALSMNGKLKSWNIVTAKQQSKNWINNLELDKYEIQNEDFQRKDAVLLKSKENIEDVDDTKYFQSYLFLPQLEKQTVVVKQGDHSYKRFKLIEIENEKSVKTHFEFVHPSYGYQNIYFNDTKDKMIEVLLNFVTNLYKKVPVPGSANEVKWEFVKRIKDFPGEMLTNTAYLTPFTPCFSHYIIPDKRNGVFIIKDTFVDGHEKIIPKELLSFPTETDKADQKAYNRCKWIDSRQFMIVSEEGIEKIVDTQDNFAEIGYNLRPLFTELSGNEYEKYPYYFERSDLGSRGDVLMRLKRGYQQYKTSYFLFKKQSDVELYKDLITVDQHQFNCNNNSFTFLHWSIIEQIQNGELEIADLQPDVLEQLLYNILPGGNTVLHKLADNEVELIQIFKVSHPDFENPEPTLHVPFIPNLKKESPIHRCIAKLDYKSIDTILKYLKFYPIDHHSRAIRDVYGEMIKKDLPEFLPYLESRMLQSAQSERINKGCLKTDFEGMVPCELWFKEKDLKDQIMREKPVETRIKCEFIDLPGIYHYQDGEFMEVFSSLADTERIEYFNLKVIQKIVDFNYPLVKEYIIKKLFIPYVCFQLSYMLFMHNVYTSDIEWVQQYVYYPNLALIFLFATYFLVNEAKQLFSDGLGYLANFWNYIDLIPPIGIYMIVVMMLLARADIALPTNAQASLEAIITFFMWFKFLYFLRIFKSTGYLIRMIIEVIIDMKNFFLVLFITIAAFGDAFLRISIYNTYSDDDSNQQFTTGFVDSIIYTYRMVLGDFDTGAFGEVSTSLVMVLFLICTVFNMIVMLNLLIAIISDSYARVAAISEQATFQERCRMISENNYLIPDSVKSNYALKDKYLLIVTDLEQEQGEKKDPVTETILAMREAFDVQLKANKAIAVKIDEKQNEIQETLKSHLNQFKALRTLLYINMPQKKIKVRTHHEPLIRYIFENLKLEAPEYADGWGCNGLEMRGCMGGRDYYNNDPAEERYHCAKCRFDLCQECATHYGEDCHSHELEKVTHQDVMDRNPGSYYHWNCDGRKFPSKCPANDINTNDMDVVYHDPKENYDLCEHCANQYKEGDVEQ